MKKLLAILLVLPLSISAVEFIPEVDVIQRMDEIIGSYPSAGSREEAADFAELFRWQAIRTDEQCKAAQAEVPVNFDRFFGERFGIFSKREIRRYKPLFYTHLLRGGAVSTYGKQKYKRPRPYDNNSALRPCIDKSDSYAYPSGHTLTSRVIALVLSEKFPERAEKIMKRADEIALNRVIGGVHHPSDIVAGKLLADEMAKKLLEKDSFRKDLGLSER